MRLSFMAIVSSLFFSTASTHALAQQPCASRVVVNRKCVSKDLIARLQQQFGRTPPAGRYWYDHKSGLYGPDGGTAVGVVAANLPFKGRLRPDASGGQTKVFINGRELNYAEVQFLRQLGPVRPGRYWMDSAFNVGIEGSPMPFVNLATLMQQRNRRSNGGYSWSSKHFKGTHSGSDGRCSYVTTPSGTVMTGDCD